MFILTVARWFAGLASAAILAGAAYLLWTWRQGEWVRDPAGELWRLREDWRLWTGLLLLAWSFVGRWIVPLLLTKGGGRRSRPLRSQGAIQQGASGSSLYVERHGPVGAPYIVFTHGWGMDCTFWDYARQDLSERFQVVRWDLPGLGRSRAPGGKVSLSNFAADLLGLIATLDRPAVLVGHSIGGMTIQTLLRDHPSSLERVAGVVLLNTTYTNPLKTMVFHRLLLGIQKPVLEPLMKLTVLLHPVVWLSKWQSYLSGSTHAAMRLGFGRFVTRSQLEHVALLATRAPPAIEARGDLAMVHWDATGVLEHSQTPALVVGGDLDIVTKLEASEQLARAPAARLMVIEGVNHMGPLEQADRYNQAISAFALSVQPGQGVGNHPAPMEVGQAPGSPSVAKRPVTHP